MSTSLPPDDPSALEFSALESRLYRRRWDHGLLDLAIGLGLATIGWDLLLGESYAFVVFWVLAMTWGRSRTRRLLEARMGRVRFAQERQERLRRGRQALMIGLAAAALAGVAVFLLTEPGAGGPRGRLMFAALLGAAVGGAAVSLSLPRLWGWALVIPAAFVVGHQAGGRAGQPYWILGAGGAIALVGLGLFLRFLQRYPRPVEETA